MMKQSQIKLNPANPRTIKDEKFHKLVNSIRDFPKMMELRPIVIDTDGTILGGNMRFKAIQELGFKEVPDSWVRRADDLTDAEKQRFIISDNSGFGEWDYEALAADWDAQDLEDWGVDVPDWGGQPEAKEDDYEVPDEIETDIVVGDLFEIGEHRLLCGDSTDSDEVAKLMNGEKANMVFTDPPYDLENEDYSENILLFTENAHVFVMHDDRGILNYLKRSQLDFDRFFVANFGFAQPRGNDPYLQHILISHEKNGSAISHQNEHDSFRSIVKLEYRHTLKDEKYHDHQKPVKFVGQFIQHYSKENSTILDLFLGSGTTMVAAHQLNRKCYGMELDPKYLQVIIDRMRKLDPNIVIKKNGTTIPN